MGLKGIWKATKIIFKDAIGDFKKDLVTYLKPIGIGLFTIAIAYGTAYFIDAMKSTSSIAIIRNLGPMNNFALIMFIIITSYLYMISSKNEEIKKLKKEIDEGW